MSTNWECGERENQKVGDRLAEPHEKKSDRELETREKKRQKRRISLEKQRDIPAERLNKKCERKVG